MRNIQDETNLNQKKVLLRLDLNVPLDNGKITDTTRIDKILPTINFLLKNEAKIIILSHVGRPKGKVVSELSLKPICEDLKNKLNENIRLISKNIKEINSNDLFNEQDEKIVTLENLRFYEEEEKNDNGFAKHLASLADIYVNDAFSCSHRAHASIFEITKFIPSYAGLQLNLEIDALTKITSEIQRPITCIIGGSKISSKINIIKNLITKFDNIIIVGGMANNILKYKECEIGKSIQEDNCDKIIEEIFSLSKKENCKIIYPEDVAVGKSLEGSAEIKELNNISKDELILDIGPKTIKAINLLIEESSTILWNGPAGYFENPNFAKGSIEIAKKIIEKNKNNTIYSVAGGGDTVSLLNGIGATNNFNFVSTAGGAFLEYLEGKELPGIKALN
ncbi:phosphoglycerate kinase [Candidatus Pelagibacter communis]|uniref:Phosphoglycerate kinase n=1 Tax=Pelagibacter ubique (strain HTCC1062) TaxID=335992 RepID=Q4FN33_PELUB|nr:phosphoglycerate kinase [Candidatus Pelagibacter ubique]AAZ21406.1 phosphoglycerate kinase [Candidatus Pelagibacter ubique HTCC1062]